VRPDPEAGTDVDPASVADAFVAALPGISWFGGVGSPLAVAELNVASRYLAGIGRRGLAVEAVATWWDTAEVASDPTWDRSLWDWEERVRLSLLSATDGVIGEPLGVELLSRVIDVASQVTFAAASGVLAEAGDCDPYLVRVASGAASQAAYQAGLAAIAGAGPDHPFVLKLELYRAGRWPLGIVAGAYRIF